MDEKSKQKTWLSKIVKLQILLFWFFEKIDWFWELWKEKRAILKKNIWNYYLNILYSFFIFFLFIKKLDGIRTKIMGTGLDLIVTQHFTMIWNQSRWSSFETLQERRIHGNTPYRRAYHNKFMFYYFIFIRKKWEKRELKLPRLIWIIWYFKFPWGFNQCFIGSC